MARTLRICQPGEDHPLFVLTQHGRHVTIEEAATEALRAEVQTTVRRGLLEWRKDQDGVPFQRLTPSHDQQFLERYASQLSEEFGFEFRLENRPEPAHRLPASKAVLGLVDVNPHSQRPLPRVSEEPTCS